MDKLMHFIRNYIIQYFLSRSNLHCFNLRLIEFLKVRGFLLSGWTVGIPSAAEKSIRQMLCPI